MEHPIEQGIGPLPSGYAVDTAFVDQAGHVLKRLSANQTRSRDVGRQNGLMKLGAPCDPKMCIRDRLVAEALNIVDESGLSYKLGAMHTRCV